MFREALFVIAQTWKRPKCPLVGEWINKLWCIQAMEYYSVLKISKPGWEGSLGENRYMYVYG